MFHNKLGQNVLTGAPLKNKGVMTKCQELWVSHYAIQICYKSKENLYRNLVEI